MYEHTPSDVVSPQVTVVSTHAVDIFTQDDGSQRRVPGGPALYMTDAFRRLGVDFHLITGEVAESYVTSTPGGETYTIGPIAPIPLPPRFDSAAVVLSPIVGEIDPDDMPPVSGLLIVDLQGFVRVPGIASNAVTSHFELAAMLSRAHVVKASEAELRRLTEASRAALERSVLLVTLGDRGALVCVDGHEELVRARPVQPSDTIGAGDTYLAAFTAAKLSQADPVRAAVRAARFTEHVLQQRT